MDNIKLGDKLKAEVSSLLVQIQQLQASANKQIDLFLEAKGADPEQQYSLDTESWTLKMVPKQEIAKKKK